MAESVVIGANTLICAVVFAPWVMPRETISGILGRWSATEAGLKKAFAVRGAAVVDALVFWEPDHCAHAYRVERRARMLR